MTTPAPNQPLPADEAWLERNWAWALPTGCLSMLLFIGGCGGLMYWGGIQGVKNSSPYREAVEAAIKNPEVVESLGEPIQTGMLDNTAIVTKNEKDNTITAKFTIPMTGSKSTGGLYLEADATAEQKWTFKELTFRLANSPQVINLLQELPPELIQQSMIQPEPAKKE